MIARYASSLTLGVGVTLALLALMHALVALDRAPVIGKRAPQLVDFVRVEKPPPEPAPAERLEPPDEVPPTPERPELDPSHATVTPIGGGQPAAPPPPVARDPGWLALTDGPLLPIATVAPSYPAGARNLEGYVVVEYSVTSNGSVSHVTVIESTHRIFERAAVDAVYKFKYRPRVVGGRPVEVAGVRQRIRFVLDGQ